ATSHDFWLRNLGSRAWKWLHMSVYVAYGLLVLHVVFGALRSEASLVYPVLLGVGAAGLGVLHLAAGVREAGRDAAPAKPLESPDADGAVWVDVCAVLDIPEGRGRPCPLRHEDGRVERVAVFKYASNGRVLVSATTNVCAHQGGPLGEGEIIDGCATCPWHGWQYRPGDGCAPPPFTERIPTYRVRVVAGRVQVEPRALAPGTPVEPAVADGGGGDGGMPEGAVLEGDAHG
ncbi:MAG: Rieske 2Fe-2S domain-containing protein, partial [Phycisphaerales bacterium]|nr:Rieske 2Fe-2S domain-containing protein [Phycisphaerales bacterium]